MESHRSSDPRTAGYFTGLKQIAYLQPDAIPWDCSHLSPTSAITNSRVSAARIQFTQQQTREVAPSKIRRRRMRRLAGSCTSDDHACIRQHTPLTYRRTVLLGFSYVPVLLLDTRQLLRSLKVIAINITPKYYLSVASVSSRRVQGHIRLHHL